MAHKPPETPPHTTKTTALGDGGTPESGASMPGDSKSDGSMPGGTRANPTAASAGISPPQQAARASHRPQTFASFRHRNFQLWFIGQIISVIGTWMQIIAQGWLVYDISRSELMLGIVSFASAIPVLIVSPWGGVITDVIPRRTVLVITQAGAMLLAFVLAGLTFTGLVQVWHIIVLAALLGIINAFDAPARQAIVVELVGREDLSNAIALNSLMFNSARVVGPAAGGLLLAWLGSAWCFLINGASYIAVIVCLLLIRLPAQVRPRRVENAWGKFIDGLRYARSRREIAGLLVLATVFSVFGLSYQSLLPAFVDKNLHAGASTYGLLNALIGLGAVASALFMARFGRSGIRGKLLLGANLVFSILLAAFAFNTNLILALALGFGLGAGFMLQGNTQNTLLQDRVDDQVRGRVMSLYTLTFFGLSPFGALAVGALAERTSMSLAIALTAVMLLVLSLLIQWKVPELRKMG